MEHLQYFGLNDDPFRSDPLERFQLEIRSQQDALRRVDRGVRQSRSLIVVSGAVGSGKSTVLRKLYEDLEEEVFEASMMLVLRGSVDADWLLRRFASQLGVEDPAQEREELVGQVYERLAIIREDGRHAVLIIDDAHALAVCDTLRELFALVKLEYEDRRLLTVVLAGAPRLAEVIDTDRDLAEQVDVRLELRPFSPEETAGYLGQRVEMASGHARLMLPDAVAALHDLSHGRPGLLNKLADNALFESYLAGRSELVKADVERAHADLCWESPIVSAEVQATPEPANSEPANRANGATPPPMSVPALQGGNCEAEITLGRDSLGDLESELEAVFEPETPVPAAGSPTLLTDFDRPAQAAQPKVEPAAVQSAPELQLEVLDAPPKDVDEVDDLFMELLDD